MVFQLPRADDDRVTSRSRAPFDRISPSDVQLPFEMLQDWPWPFEADDDVLLPNILSGWTR